MHAFAALLPVLVVLLGLWRGLPALRVAGLGVLVALAVVALEAGMGLPMPDTQALGAAARRWAPVVLEVVLIIGAGLALSQLLHACGAQAALAARLRQHAGQGVGAGLLVVHAVVPFAESITGFGIGMTVGIPLLLALGVPPARAALLGLLGLCTVPWGSMGPGTMIAAHMAGLSTDALGAASAWLSLPPFLVAGWVVVALLGREQQRVRDGLWASASALSLWLAVLGINLWLGTPLAGALGALLVMALHLAVHGCAAVARPAAGSSVESKAEASALTGACPVASSGLSAPTSPTAPMAAIDQAEKAAWAWQAYAVVLGGLLAMRIGLQTWGPGQGPIMALASPALWLWLAVGYVAMRMQGCATGPHWRAPLGRAVHQWGYVAAVAVLYIVLGLVMAQAGMAARLAQALGGLGQMYAWLAPFVAALGGFVTGSNSAANAMLADTQARIAVHMGVPLLPFMAAHNVSAALLLMASPAKVEMAVQLASQPEQPAATQSTPSTPSSTPKPLLSTAASRRAWVQRMVLLAALPSILAMALWNVLGWQLPIEGMLDSYLITNQNK